MAEYHQVGKYVLLRELPETPLGRNFRAAELGMTGMNRIVHLTRLINEVTPEVKFQQMLQAKFIGMTPLLHEGVAKGFEINNINGLFISQEYVQGFSIKAILKRCVKNNLPFSLDYALYVASKMCNVLEYAHNQVVGGVPFIHGGITPYNVYITFDGDVKVLDWSVVSNADNMATARNIFLQRYQLYLAPEQVEGKPASNSVDIFQVGLLFYEMITGNPLFTINRLENVQRMVEELFTIQRVFDGKTPPPEMVNILSKALSIDPSTRFSSIRALREELDTLLYSGAYLATVTKTSFFINSIYKDEIKNIKANMSSEYNMNYAAYLTAATAAPAAAQTGNVNEVTAEEISTQILPDTGEIMVEDEDIGSEVGDDFISYTRKKQSPLIPGLLGSAAVIIVILLIIIIAGRKEPELRPIDTPEALARKVELAEMKRKVEQLTKEESTRAEEKKQAEQRLLELQAVSERRVLETQKLLEDERKIRQQEEQRRLDAEKEKEKQQNAEREENERLARLAATLDTSSSQPQTNPGTETRNPATSPATTITKPPTSGGPTASSANIQVGISIVRGDDPNLVMQPVNQPAATYPKSLAKAGIRRRAEVVLLLTINPDGTIEKIQPLGGEAVFQAEARKAVLQWRYTPPVMKDGRKVKVVKTVTLKF